jgi:N6-adenosine-specific RNA methylase IME4/ParB-like chromosome segregation protein Spo0J
MTEKRNPAPREVGTGGGKGKSDATTPPYTPPRPPSKGRRIADIRVGRRHRHDLGDVEQLAASIKDVGLLHPVVITPDGKLIAGQRRLEACKKLGWMHVPVRIVDIDAVVRGEFAENAVRKDFTLSEAVAIKRALEPVERAAAKERMLAGKPSGKFPKGRALDKVAKVVGKDRTTITKAAAVADAAEAEPDKYGHLLAAMDRTGRVNGAYRRLKNAQQAEAIRAEPPPLPQRGPYRVGVVDVPWPFEVNDPDPSHRGAWPFPTMSIDQICALDVGSIMHEDAILFFWTINFHMRLAFKVLDAWGFRQTPTILTWAKDRMGNGHWLRGQTEHAIIAVRGNPIVTLTNQTTLLHAPVRGHSVKPVEFYNLVESLCPAPRYCDLFSRYQHNEKWDCHGDQAPVAADLTEAAE